MPGDADGRNSQIANSFRPVDACDSHWNITQLLLYSREYLAEKPHQGVGIWAWLLVDRADEQESMTGIERNITSDGIDAVTEHIHASNAVGQKCLPVAAGHGDHTVSSSRELDLLSHRNRYLLLGHWPA